MLTSKGKQDTNLKQSGPSSPHAQAVADKQHDIHPAPNSLDTNECPAGRLTGFLRSLWLELSPPADLQKRWKLLIFHTSLPYNQTDHDLIINTSRWFQHQRCELRAIICHSCDASTVAQSMMEQTHAQQTCAYMAAKAEGPQVHSQAPECSQHSSSRANTVWPC